MGNAKRAFPFLPLLTRKVGDLSRAIPTTNLNTPFVALRISLRTILASGVLLTSTLLAKESNPKLHRFEDSRVSMACTYTVAVYGTDPKQLPLITTAALDEVDRIDALMSNYRPESPLSQINREASGGPVPVEPELFRFLESCVRYSQQSEGAFDITVGPLMKAWGFFRGEGRMPSEAELAEARSRVGYRRVILNQKDGTIFFDRAGVELDLGGIAKGYAVDRAVAVLK